MSDDKIVELFPAKDPDTVLTRAVSKFEEAIVIGVTAGGTVELSASLGLAKADVMWNLEIAKSILMDAESAE